MLLISEQDLKKITSTAIRVDDLRELLEVSGLYWQISSTDDTFTVYIDGYEHDLELHGTYIND